MIEKDVIHNADCIAGIQQMLAQGYAERVITRKRDFAINLTRNVILCVMPI